MSGYIKYGLLIAVVALVAYKSVYFEKLSTRTNTVANAFDAVAFGKQLWNEKMPAKIDSAVQLTTLIDEIEKDVEVGVNKYTNALAIGNYRYALVKLTADVLDVKEDEVILGAKHNDSVLTLNLATEFIYGNAVRDASGLVQVEKFPNSTDLNNLSEALNKIIRTTVLPSFKTAIQKGDKVVLVAAVELNKEHIHWNGIELLPVKIEILK
ncbi:MAG TPA: DUF2291 family protein [Chitinophagaceae bacterium]